MDTSNLNIASEPPKKYDAILNQHMMERPEDSKPPRYRYSLRLANMAAAEKQAKASAVPTNAPTRMLQYQKKMSITSANKHRNKHCTVVEAT